LAFEAKVFFFQVATSRGTTKEAFSSVKDAGGESSNWRANQPYRLVGEADAALSPRISLEERKGNRYAEECKEEEAICFW
jgi:hypothetical protein